MQENVKISKMDKKKANLKTKINKFSLKNCMTISSYESTFM